jgi:hypothetical protein
MPAVLPTPLFMNRHVLRHSPRHIILNTTTADSRLDRIDQVH